MSGPPSSPSSSSSSSSTTTSKTSSRPQNLSKTLSVQSLIKRGLRPTLRSLNRLLLSLGNAQRLLSILSLFSQLHSNRFKPSNALNLSLISSSLLHHLTPQQTRLFIAQFRNTRALSNAPKRPLPQLHLSHLLRRCPCVSPSLFTLYSFLFYFNSRGDVHRAIEVLELMLESGIPRPFDEFVSNSIISGFCSIGKPEFALEFYQNSLKDGIFRPNLATYTTVVVALCRQGRIAEVNDLVCRMEKEGLVLDTVLYSNWIYGCFRGGALEEAFRKHRSMVESGIRPDVISYTILIDGFCKEGNVEKAVGLLNEMKKSSCEPTLVTYTAIVRGYCKKNKLEEAFGVFWKVEELGIEIDEVMYAVLIDGLCRNGDLERVFALLEEMEKREISAGVVTYNTVVNGLCKVGKTCEASELSKVIQGDNFTYSTLMHGYLREGDMRGVLETIRRLEDDGISMDVVTCNILIKALFMAGSFEDAHMLFKGMPNAGLVPNSITYHIMIVGCCRVGRIDEALQVLDECRRALTVPGAVIYNRIIQGLCADGMMDMAIEVFGELAERGVAPDGIAFMTLMKLIYEEGGEDVVLRFIHRVQGSNPDMHSLICNYAVCFLSKKGCFEAAYRIYMMMKMEGSVVSSKSYYVILKRLIQNGNKQLAQLMLNECLKVYGSFDPRIGRIVDIYLCRMDVNKALQFLDKNGEKNMSPSVFTAVIDALAKEGRVEEALKLVLEAEENGSVFDVVVYSILVNGFCKEGYLDRALDICASMRKKGISPNIVTYNSIIGCLCRQGFLIKAFRLLDSMESNHVLPTVVTYAILIDALCKEGFLQDANEFFKKMVLKGLVPNTRVYNLLINGYCQSGLVGDALKLVLDLEASCLQPDAFTVSAIINGYFQTGDMEGALQFFGDYKIKGFLPDFLGFVKLIKGLCAKGRMEEARSVLREMLQCNTVIELLSKAGDDIKMDSLTSFIFSLCEQGSIAEATKVLSEVGVMFFPSERSVCSSESLKVSLMNQKEDWHAYGPCLDPGGGGALRLRKMSPANMSRVDVDDLKFRQVKGEERSIYRENRSHFMGRSLLHNFGTYYSIISSLCSKGELKKANKVAEEMLLDLNGCR